MPMICAQAGELACKTPMQHLSTEFPKVCHTAYMTKQCISYMCATGGAGCHKGCGPRWCLPLLSSDTL